LLILGGVLVAWKGATSAEEERGGERAARQLGLEALGARPVEPFPDAERRHLHVFAKVRSSPEEFPRRPGMARKRPLA
jgi:16S rRNA (guanine527-N7)-methyltransferase